MDHSDLEDTKCASAAQSWLGVSEKQSATQSGKRSFLSLVVCQGQTLPR